ncbi:MAG: hypothetical protein LBG77_09325 [Dysgonamonadaceae bacterium]|jgi:hypothetical protein|nr:hypothetical protein [Dysgonamonadaceae bacterium]
MQYQSLIRLLTHCGIDTNQTPDAGKIRKILSAEFSLSETGMISIDGFDYIKNDVFRELEAGNAVQILKYHQRIWNNSSLLQCLEQNIVDFRTVSSWFEMTADRDFVGFISPYFSESFNKIMRQYLQEMNFGEATRLMRMDIFIAGADDENRAYSSLRTFLTDTVHELKNVNEVTYTSLRPQLDAWTLRDTAPFLNRLPDSLYDVKHDLVNAFINLMVLIQRQNRSLCYAISAMLYELTNLRPDVQQLISDNHKIVEQNAKGNTGKNERNVSSYIWILFVVISALVRIASTCNDHSSRNSYTSPSIPTIQLESLTKERIRAVLDSLSINTFVADSQGKRIKP